jgi:hypothetical protein
LTQSWNKDFIQANRAGILPQFWGVIYRSFGGKIDFCLQYWGGFRLKKGLLINKVVWDGGFI